MALITRANAAALSSLYRPRSLAEIRPSAETAVASTISIAAPDNARFPRCIMCQSVAEPSAAEYWHIGAITILLARLRVPISNGENN